MTISIPILGQSVLGGLRPPNGTLGTGLLEGDGLSQEPDFASLIGTAARDRPESVPTEAFDALGMFGRDAALRGEEAPREKPGSGDPAIGTAQGVGATIPLSIELLLATPEETSTDAAALGAVRSSSSAGFAEPAAFAPEPMQWLAAQALTPTASTPEALEDEPAASATLSKDAALPRSQPVSAAVLLEGGGLQVVVRSNEAAPDQALALRNRIEDLAREFDLSLDGVRLNGVVLPPAASGAAHGRRTN